MILKDQNSPVGFVSTEPEDYVDAFFCYEGFLNDWERDVLDIELMLVEEKTNEEA